MAYNIKIEENQLVLEYQIEYASNNWVKEKLDEDGYVILKKTFQLKKEDIIREDKSEDELEGTTYIFKIGTFDNEYYLLNSAIFNTKNSFFFHTNINLNIKLLVHNGKISILKKIDNLASENIYIGGENPNAIPKDEYLKLVKKFPNSYEINKYVNARISSILIDYVGSIEDAEKKYNDYINKKTTAKKENILKVFKEQEIYKYTTLLEKLECMLKDEVNYSEYQWQEQILQVLLLLFPKYISAIKEVAFKDTHNNKKRSLDYALVDYFGNIDVVEIKKPFEKSIVTQRKYRDNYIPKRELSGTVMQIEKYIYYLNKWGNEGEKKLTQKFKASIPHNISIKITNPRGLIIMGRDNELTKEQLHDFEIIKRKYKNIMDIFTYDDLIQRIKVSIAQMKKI